jgi:hypothetical protein
LEWTRTRRRPRSKCFEAELGERALADADQEEELERDAIAELGLSRDDAVDDVAVEQRTLDVAQPRAPDRDDRVALELELALRPAEEGHEHGPHLLARPRRGVAPALVDELAEACRACRRLEVHEFEVGVVERQLRQDRLVVAQRLLRGAVLVPKPAHEMGDLEADRSCPVRLVFHALSLAHDPRGLGESQARRRLRSARRCLDRLDRRQLEAELGERWLRHGRRQ